MRAFAQRMKFEDAIKIECVDEIVILKKSFGSAPEING